MTAQLVISITVPMGQAWRGLELWLLRSDKGSRLALRPWHCPRTRQHMGSWIFVSLPRLSSRSR
jgi:hypothetical protein